MKRFAKSILGVTLLEVMLVLAIVAMIIVMSIRYYQSASASQQATQVIEQIQSIAAAADSLSTATGSYTGSVSNTSLDGLLPVNGRNTPWGSTVSVKAETASTYTLTVTGAPQGVCGLIVANVKNNTHFSAPTPATCPASGITNLTYTYTKNV